MQLTCNLGLKQVAGSLTLGGYDASRFLPSNVSFAFAGDVSRDLVVGIQSIMVNGLNTSSTAPLNGNLLPNPILSFIDSGVPQIWLPLEACNLFEAAFGLQYDPVTELYLINETTHAALVAQNSSITFTIATDISSASSILIVFPYAAFDLQLTADYPSINETTHYFPIRRAANETQYTLGRTFLQEAYIIADYERSNFSINQCVFSESAPENIQTIFPTPNATISSSLPTSTPSPSSHSNSTGIKTGLAVAVAVVALILFSIVLLIRHRRGKRKQVPDYIEKQNPVAEMDLGRQKPGELPEDLRQPPELEDSQKARQELQGCRGGYELEQTRDSVAESQTDRIMGETEGELGPPYELPATKKEGAHDYS